jgi:hypothetical protein
MFRVCTILKIDLSCQVASISQVGVIGYKQMAIVFSSNCILVLRLPA